MASRLISSFVRCSISSVPFFYGSRFYSTTPLISRTLILRNLISKPCCVISIKSASSKSLASENDKIKRADENLLRFLESEIAEKELQENIFPKDFQIEIIHNPKDLQAVLDSTKESVALKREYGDEQIQATANIYTDMCTQEIQMFLAVTIEKKVGPTLNFSCWLARDSFRIRYMSLGSSENSDEDGFQRFDFIGLDKRSQKAFDKYLAARGFKKSLFDYLRDYVSSRGKGKVAGLKSLRDFIKN